MLTPGDWIVLGVGAATLALNVWNRLDARAASKERDGTREQKMLESRLGSVESVLNTHLGECSEGNRWIKETLQRIEKQLNRRLEATERGVTQLQAQMRNAATGMANTVIHHTSNAKETSDE